MNRSHEAEERARDEKLVASEKNTARYFTENRHVAWVALVLTLLWGGYAYSKMPKAKDPFVEVRVAVVACAWPGASAEDVEQLVTRKLERTIAGNAGIEKLESTSRTSLALVAVTLKESIPDTDKEWNDIQARLSSIGDLPSGAGPAQLQKDFGETTTLMLTVASTRITDVEVDLRADSLRRAIEAARTTAERPALRATIALGFPPELNAASMARLGASAKTYFESRAGVRDARYFQSPGFLALDVEATVDDATLLGYLKDFAAPRTLLSELHPDVWEPTVIRTPADTRGRLVAVRGFRFSYRDLDVQTEAMERHLRSLPSVSKVVRSGVLPEEIHLEYSQERLASFGLDMTKAREHSRRAQHLRAAVASSISEASPSRSPRPVSCAPRRRSAASRSARHETVSRRTCATSSTSHAVISPRPGSRARSHYRRRTATSRTIEPSRSPSSCARGPRSAPSGPRSTSD